MAKKKKLKKFFGKAKAAVKKTTARVQKAGKFFKKAASKVKTIRKTKVGKFFKNAGKGLKAVTNKLADSKLVGLVGKVVPIVGIGQMALKKVDDITNAVKKSGVMDVAQLAKTIVKEGGKPTPEAIKSLQSEVEKNLQKQGVKSVPVVDKRSVSERVANEQGTVTTTQKVDAVVSKNKQAISIGAGIAAAAGVLLTLFKK